MRAPPLEKLEYVIFIQFSSHYLSPYGVLPTAPVTLTDVGQEGGLTYPTTSIHAIPLYHLIFQSQLGLGTEFRSEKIPRNRLGMVSAIPRKKVLLPRHSEFHGRANSEARNGTERNEIPRKKNMTPTVDMQRL